MAKGFTVKTAAPIKKKDPANEFSIEKAKEMVKGRQWYSVYLVEEFLTFF